MKKPARLLAILIVLLAASAVPSSAIIPNCWEFCSCEVNCDWGCWDITTSSGTNCGDWGVCSGHCGAARVSQSAWLVSVQPSAPSAPSATDRLPVWAAASCTPGAAMTRPSSSEAAH